MKNILNRVTLILFGFPCYYKQPKNNILENKPTFSSYYPENYDPNNIDQFNSWSIRTFMHIPTSKN